MHCTTPAAQVLPALGDTPSEAQLNLVISALRAGRIDEASALMQDIDPTTPHEYILKVCLSVPQTFSECHCSGNSSSPWWPRAAAP